MVFADSRKFAEEWTFRFLRSQTTAHMTGRARLVAGYSSRCPCRSSRLQLVRAPARSLEELRAMVGALDPDCLAAENDVDRTLIEIALMRSPLERVRFAQQMLETLLRFRRVESSGL